MAWPNQNTTNESSAGALLLSNAIATGITNAGALSQQALMQEVVSNLLIEPPPGLVLTGLTGAIATTSSIKSLSPSAGVGYGTGAGGLITQATNKSTPVVLNKIVGAILTHNAEILPGAEATFTCTNTSVVATDVVVANAGGAAATGKYGCFVNNVGAGAFDITLTNLSIISTTEVVTVNFAVIKGVTS